MVILYYSKRLQWAKVSDKRHIEKQHHAVCVGRTVLLLSYCVILFQRLLQMVPVLPAAERVYRSLP